MTRKKYLKVARTSEIPKNQMKVFEVDKREILIANVEAKFYAVSNRCPHMNFPLYLGSLNGKIITCGFHYAKFDITTRKALSPPAREPLKTFKVKLQASAASLTHPSSSSSNVSATTSFSFVIFLAPSMLDFPSTSESWKNRGHNSTHAPNP